MKKHRKTTKSPSGPTKFVRIDPRTQIEVSIDIPDNLAILHYLERRQLYSPVTRLYARESHYIIKD